MKGIIIMKFTARHEKQLREYLAKADKNGCLPVDEWTTGSGKYSRTRVLPPFVARFDRKEYPSCSRPQMGTSERAAYNYFIANPRRKSVLVLDKVVLFNFLFDAAHLAEF